MRFFLMRQSFYGSEIIVKEKLKKLKTYVPAAFLAMKNP